MFLGTLSHSTAADNRAHLVSNDTEKISHGSAIVPPILAQIIDQALVQPFEPIIADYGRRGLQMDEHNIWWIAFHDLESVAGFAKEV